MCLGRVWPNNHDKIACINWKDNYKPSQFMELSLLIHYCLYSEIFTQKPLGFQQWLTIYLHVIFIQSICDYEMQRTFSATPSVKGIPTKKYVKVLHWNNCCECSLRSFCFECLYSSLKLLRCITLRLVNDSVWYYFIVLLHKIIVYKYTR